METTNSWVDFSITSGLIRDRDRNKIGMRIRVWARPDIEDFMRAAAQDQTVPVDAVGDGWTNADPSGKPLLYYDGKIKLEAPSRVYTLDAINGAPIISNTNERLARAGVVVTAEDVVNLSFLRLVGISKNEGLTISLDGAYSGEYLRKLKMLLPGAVKQFLQDFVIPVTINLQVISRS